MPFAPQIRKQIIQTLDQSIIPMLTEREIQQILADAPFDFSLAESWPLRKTFLQEKKKDPTQIVWQWKKFHLVASRMSYWGFVYEGIMDEKIGLTRNTAKGSDAAGITAVRLKAPAVLYLRHFAIDRFFLYNFHLRRIGILVTRRHLRRCNVMSCNKSNPRTSI